MNSFSSSLVATIIVVFSGCAQQPANPKVDLSQERKDFSLKVEDVEFPKGFPAGIKLLKPTRIYEQTDPSDGVTWDTSVSPSEFRDHYVQEFKRLGFEPKVNIPGGLPGECYEIQALDKKVGKWHCVAVGKGHIGNEVKCFLLCREVNPSDENSE